MQDKAKVSLTEKNIFKILVLSHRHISKVYKDASITIDKTSRSTIFWMPVLSHRHVSKIYKDASITLNKTSRTKFRSV